MTCYITLSTMENGACYRAKKHDQGTCVFSALTKRLINHKDKFVLFSVVWNQFTENCISCYTPGAFVTVDELEQLFPRKSKCPFKQFMASKPDNFGQKFWLAVDKERKYVINRYLNVEKDKTSSKDERISDQVVMQLVKPFLQQRAKRENRLSFYLHKVGHTSAKTQNQLTGNNEQNLQRSASSGKAYEKTNAGYYTTLYKSGNATRAVYQSKEK